MIRIGVLADTHIPGRAKELPTAVLQAFKDVERIIHAGDITSMGVIEQLAALTPVTAVAGNVDGPEIHQAFGEKAIIDTGHYRIGVVHGHGEKGRTPERAFERFKDDGVDCIIFGHSHMPYCQYHNGILLFNPGSPTDKRRNDYYSFGIIEIDTMVTPRLIYFNKGNEIMSNVLRKSND